MQDTLFVVYHLGPFFITVGALMALLVISQALLFVQVGRLRKELATHVAEGETAK